MVLVLSVYPTYPALHGGQIRLQNIVRAYENAGFYVRVRGVLPVDYEIGDLREAFLPMPDVSRLPFASLGGWVIDYLVAPAVERDPLFGELAALVDDCEPDVVHLEQPWLWPFVRRMLSEEKLSGCYIVYGSQNVECSLKREILLRHFAKAVVEEVAGAIEEIERELSQKADLILAVSGNDADAIRLWTDRPIVVAKNGVEPWTADEECRGIGRALCSSRRFGLFASSAHLPNVDGFLDIAGPALGFVRPTERVVIVGAAGSLIYKDPRFQAYGDLNRSRAVILGPVSQRLLDALRDLAHVFLLPIVSGGGTNLKTSEALWSGKYVVGTPSAFRGFERFMCGSGVMIVRTSQGFKAAVRECLEAPPFVLPAEERQLRKELLWTRTLRPMIQGVGELLQREGR